MTDASPRDDRYPVLLYKLKTALVTRVRAMRWCYLPLLMIYFAYGALGLVTIAEAFWVKGSVDPHACGVLAFGRRAT